MAAKTEPQLQGLTARLDSALAGGEAGPLETYLRAESRLPGPRSNLELLAQFAAAVAAVVCRPDPPVARLEALLDGWAALPLEVAPVNDPGEFLPAAATLAYGYVAAARPAWWGDEVAKLHRAARSPRWRTREMVASALQRMAAADWDRTLAVVDHWVTDLHPLVVRAAAAAVAEPALLTGAIRGGQAVAVQAAAVAWLMAVPATRRRDPDVRVLRQALGYSLSVATAAAPDAGFALLGRLARSADPDLQWILRENVKKTRLRPWPAQIAALQGAPATEKGTNPMIRLYDTRTATVQDLDFPDETVKMYVCGITPYDTSHLGHARVAVVYDTLRRYLEWRGLHVRYVQNVTDIDEPLFERANRDDVDWRELGDRQTERYLQSLALLHVERPEYFVKATEAIDEMIPRIARLVELGHAYVAGGSVYYDVTTRPDYGEILHADEATMLATANEMGNNPDDPKKRHPLDFVLWQPSQPGEPHWPSPWGPGRPGWHIECSTIATAYLGPQLDIHGGGADLIFPHHASEIAQAEPVTGVTPFVRAWMHTGLVELGGTKMSKSLGNMVFVADVLETNSSNALRLSILEQPYRDAYEYSHADVERVEQQVRAMRAALAAIGGDGPAVDTADARGRFSAALAEDFNTPLAIGVLVDLAARIREGAAASADVTAAQAELRELADVLGLVF